LVGPKIKRRTKKFNSVGLNPRKEVIEEGSLRIIGKKGRGMPFLNKWVIPRFMKGFNL